MSLFDTLTANPRPAQKVPPTRDRGAFYLKKRGPPVSPCEAVVADISGTFVGHTARQRLGEVHQLAPLDPGCRPQTVTLSRTDKTLQLRCHSRLFLPPREPGSVYIRQQTRCVMTSQARTHVNEWTIFPSTVSFPC